MKRRAKKLAALLAALALVLSCSSAAMALTLTGGGIDLGDVGGDVLEAEEIEIDSLIDSTTATTSYTTVTAPGSFSSDDSSDNTLYTWYAYKGTTATLEDADIDETSSGKNIVVAYDGAQVMLENLNISMLTSADGSDTCDFTGKGTAIAVYDSGTNVVLSNSTITTSGVATMPIFVDDSATLTVTGSKIISLGGTLYSTYTNTANQSTMVAPPWVLGIMGTSRASNLMGTNTTLNFLDSEAYAALWAVLSTDSGSGMLMNIYNSTLELTNKDETTTAIQASNGQITTVDNPYTTNYGSGYGTYVIGSCVQNVVGSTFNVGTYAAIFTGGTMNISSLTAGTYTLTSATGNSSYTYTYDGETRASVINSDTFGFMAHQGTNTLNVSSGTSITSGYTTFLVKTGGTNNSVLNSFVANISDTTISTGNNVLIQILDNEDALIGMSSGTTFNTSYTESKGWTTSGTSGSYGATVTFNFSDMDALVGNIYNASGYSLKGQALTVTLSGTTYYGAAASTTAIHVSKTGSDYVANDLNGYAVDSSSSAAASTLLGYQLSTIEISDYYNLGHVANLINSTGYNTVSMTLTSGSTWYVTGTTVLSSLSVDSTSSIVLVGDATLKVGSTTYTSSNYASGSKYNLQWVESVEIPSTGSTETCEHSYESAVTTAPTCTENGVLTYTCTLCGDSYTEAISATGHSYVSATTDPTCTEDGETTYTCSDCGDSYSEAIPATGHSYENGACTVCGSEQEITEPDASFAQSGTKSIVITGSWPTTYNGYEVTEHGFVYIRASKITTGTELTLSTSGRVKVSRSSSSSYTLVTAGVDVSYAVRAYVAYVDDSGTTCYAYSEQYFVTYNSLA